MLVTMYIFLGILTKGAGTHHLPITMSNSPTNYSPTLARLLTAPERCKQSRGKQRQTTPAATVVSSNTVPIFIQLYGNSEYYDLVRSGTYFC